MPFQIALFYQVDAEGADEESGVALALGDIAGDLGGVHGLLRGHVFERAPVVADSQQHEAQHGQADAQEARTAADFELVQSGLVKAA